MANRMGSILAADFGSVQTRVVLIDVVDGEYRMVGRGAGMTTVGYPVDDVSVGLRRILNEMAKISQRTLTDKNGKVIVPEDDERNGVDYFITTASLGRPIRAVLVGLEPDISIQAAREAVSGAYVEPAAVLHLRDERSEEERLNAVLLNRPDLIFITGGTEGGAKTALLDLLKTVQLAVRLIDEGKRPTIIYAGNTHIADDVRALFDDLAPLLVADNVMPRIGQESFESVLVELGAAYDDYRESHGEGFETIGEMSSSGVLPTAQSYALLADYLMQSTGENVLAVDIGSTSSVLVGAFNGDVSTRISTTKGLGHSAQTLFDDVGKDAIKRWLPFYPEPGELLNYALNKSLRPAAVPMSVRDLYLEHGFLRAAMTQLVEQSRPAWHGVEADASLPPIGTIIAGGAAFTQTGHPAYNMLLLADCLQPIGITTIKADPHGLIPAIGALARHQPEAAVQLLNGNNLDSLGTIISISGTPAPDSTVADLSFTTESGETIDAKLKGGHLLSLPLAANESIKVQINCAWGYSVGGKRRQTVTLSGGSGGILFDGRGRPLQPGDTPEARAERLPRWVTEATDVIEHDIPDEWLQSQEDDKDEEQPVAAPVEAGAEPDATRRGGLFGWFGSRAEDNNLEEAMPDADDTDEDDMGDFFEMEAARLDEDDDMLVDDPDDTDDVDDVTSDLRDLL